jgi:hypothetical protein
LALRPLQLLILRKANGKFEHCFTADPQSGIGAWTDAELARAIRSGVSRDGRQLHWQGMTWDQLSNLEEEDLRAIVA